jgi:lysophospholipase L1-like esterase
MKKSNALTLAVSVSISLLIFEFGLQLFTPYPLTDQPNRIGHEWLAYVMNPDLGEIDEAGFRNKTLTSVDIAVIGDSHTYGFNVTSEYSWPQLLGERLGKNVYNYGVGGYGLLHYIYLMDEAVELNPEEIILGLYFANDFFNVCQLASLIPRWAKRAEGVGLDVSVCPVQKTKKKEKEDKFRLKDKSAIASMLSELNANRKAWMKIYFPDAGSDVDIHDNRVKSLISMERIKAHNDYMDLARPEIKMAFEMLNIFLESASQKVRNENIRFTVLLIPSRERVFYDYLTENNHNLPEVYRSLVRKEDKLRQATMLLLEENKIRYGDVLPGLQQALLENSNLYPVKDDGHPLKKGYSIYADVAEKLIRSDNRDE